MRSSFLTASVSRNAGGLYEALRRLAQSMVSPGHSIMAMGIEDDKTASDVEGWAPVPVKTFPVLGPERFSFAPRLSQQIHQTDLDMLHLHGLWRYPSIVARRWHQRTGRPYIVHPHGMLDPWAVRNSQWKKVIAGTLFENATLRNASCLRALCQSEAESIRQYGCRNPICIIPNGIDLPQGNNLVQTSEAGMALRTIKETGAKVLFYIGRLHPKKGLPNLLKAWALLQNAQPSTPNSQPSTINHQPSNWVLAIAGWDELGHEQELKALATELGIPWSDIRGQVSAFSPPHPEVSAQVSGLSPQSSAPRSQPLTINHQLLFLGPQFGKDKAACYAQCDAFILPSYSEGLPMVILEAWSHSKPVLMTSECNLPEGFAAKAAIRVTTDPANIAQGLTELFQMPPAALAQMGQNGRCLAEGKFSWKEIAHQLQSVCEWLVRGAPKPDCVYSD